MNVGRLLLVLLGFLFFVIGYCNAQVSVVHFNSEWNNENNFDISTLKDCEKAEVVICHFPDLQEKHEIISVPTIIVFDEKEEIIRFQANLMMKLTCTKKDIQEAIDKIYLNKFQ